MIRILGNLPNKPYLACSGGMDSMVVLDFLIRGKYKPIVLNFNHRTTFGEQAVSFLEKRCIELGLELRVGWLKDTAHAGYSQEDYWRKCRYEWFNTFPGPIITAHHLDDATEWWIFSSLHGQGKLIPYENNNVFRPFLLTAKQELKSWAARKTVSWIDDPSNSDHKYMRSIIRHKIMKHALCVNPGLRTVIRKKLEKEFEEYHNG